MDRDDLAWTSDRLADNVEPFHCGCCGAPHRWGLCRACIETWQLPDGTLPDWLRYLRTAVNRDKKRRLRQWRLQAAGVVFHRGAAAGDHRVTPFSLDALLDAVPNTRLMRATEPDPDSPPPVAGSVPRGATPVDQRRMVGKYIRWRRMQQGLTQRGLADRVGCGNTYLSRMEGGHTEIEVGWLYRFAEALDIAVGDLVPPLDPADP